MNLLLRWTTYTDEAVRQGDAFSTFFVIYFWTALAMGLVVFLIICCQHTPGGKT